MTPQENARKLRPFIEKAATSLSDEDALEAIALYPTWVENTAYAVDDRIRYVDILYKCVQAHTSQTGWEPPLTPALWTRVSIEEWPDWIQPTGAQDAYMKDDKVSHLNKHWISTADYNIWEPSVYGWDEV